jgi:hypothetical protein
VYTFCPTLNRSATFMRRYYRNTSRKSNMACAFSWDRFQSGAYCPRRQESNHFHIPVGGDPNQTRTTMSERGRARAIIIMSPSLLDRDRIQTPRDPNWKLKLGEGHITGIPRLPNSSDLRCNRERHSISSVLYIYRERASESLRERSKWVKKVK